MGPSQLSADNAPVVTVSALVGALASGPNKFNESLANFCFFFAFILFLLELPAAQPTFLVAIQPTSTEIYLELLAMDRLKRRMAYNSSEVDKNAITHRSLILSNKSNRYNEI